MGIPIYIFRKLIGFFFFYLHPCKTNITPILHHNYTVIIPILHMDHNLSNDHLSVKGYHQVQLFLAAMSYPAGSQDTLIISLK